MPVLLQAAVTRELFVRRIAGWLPVALRRSRRATLALALSDPDTGTAEATLRAVAEFADQVRGQQLTVLLLADAEGLAARLGSIEAALPVGFHVHLLPGNLSRLPAALKAAGATGAPILACLDATTGPAPEPAALAALASGRPAEALLVLGPAAQPDRELRPELRSAGLPLTSVTRLGSASEPDTGSATSALTIAYGTALDRHLAVFKEELWTVAEGAGARLGGPDESEGFVLEDPVNPVPSDRARSHPAPLRRALLVELTRSGAQTVTELRRFALTATAYRVGDTDEVLAELVQVGAVTREPEQGRLAGDVVIAVAAPADGLSGV